MTVAFYTSSVGASRAKRRCQCPWAYDLMASMSAAFKTVALIGRYKSRDVAEPLRLLGRFLRDNGRAVVVESDTAQEAGVDDFPVDDHAGIGARADLAVVLGGDGSMLSTARAPAASGVPLVGINQGRLGFMTDIALGAMTDTMASILAGHYTLEPRTMLATEVSRGGDRLVATIALNDTVVGK